MTLALIVPVLKNFPGFAKLMASVDVPVVPIVLKNWEHNYGVGPAWNTGLRTCIDKGYEKAVIVNDDVIFAPGTLEALSHHIGREHLTVSPSNITGQGHPRGLNFWCFGLEPKSFVDKVGFFDENFAPAYFEDDDMAYRIGLSGNTFATIPGLYSYHQVWGTQNYDDTPVVGPEVWQRNLDYYISKWGGAPGNEVFTQEFDGREYIEGFI